MSKIRILANDGIDETGKKMLEAAGIEVVTTHYPAGELTEKLKEFDGITVRSATQVRQSLIDTCPNLKVIGRGGVGMDNIDVDYARQKVSGYTILPLPSSRSVAELVFAHTFNLSRQLQIMNRAMPATGQTELENLKSKPAKVQNYLENNWHHWFWQNRTRSSKNGTWPGNACSGN
jgi:D-3-phosphoglycerate dehydrogenase